MRSMDSRSLQKYIMCVIQKPKDKGKWEKEKDSQFHLKYLNFRIVLNRPKKQNKTKNKKTPQKSHTQIPLLFLISYISMVHFLQLMNQFWSNMTT